MQAQRWLRMLPGRSQLLLLCGVAFAVFVVVSFVDLAMTKNAAVERNRRAHELVQQQTDQQTEIMLALEQAQQGEHLPKRRWDYYGKLAPGMGVVEGQPGR